MNGIDLKRVRELVQEELERQLSELQLSLPTRSPPIPRDSNAKLVLVILSGLDVLLDDVFTQLLLLAKQNRLTVVPTPDFLTIMPRSELEQRLPGTDIIENIRTNEVESFIAPYNAVLVPLLSMNTLAKVALGIVDEIAPILIITALLQDKPVLAIKEGIERFFNKRDSTSASTPSIGEPPPWSGVRTAEASLGVGVPHRPPATHISALYRSYLLNLEQWGGS